MFQTLYENKKRGFACEVTPPAEFMRQYEGACADYPLMTYCIDMGIKQAIPDSMAGVTDEATFKAKILKKADAVFTGTVRVAGSGVAREPSKSPLEKEMFAIASKEMAIVLVNWEATNGALKKAERNGLIHQYLVKHNEAILARATENLAKMGTLATKVGPDLDTVLAAMKKKPEDVLASITEVDPNMPTDVNAEIPPPKKNKKAA